MPASSRPATTTTGPLRLPDVFRYHAGFADGVEPPTKPWRLGSWLWATQGHIVVAFQDDGSDADPTPEPRLKAQRYLEETPATLVPVEWRALRDFAGAAAPLHAPCLECDGDGYDNTEDLMKCEHCEKLTRRECSECGGTGLDGLPIRHARIGTVPINCALLAWALSCVPACETVQVGAIAATTTNRALTDMPFALLVVGPAWRVVVMCIREPGHNSVPTFALPSVVPEAVHVTETEDAGSQR